MDRITYFDRYSPESKTDMETATDISSLIEDIQHNFDLRSDDNAKNNLMKLISLTNQLISISGITGYPDICDFQTDRKMFEKNILKCLQTKKHYFESDLLNSDNYIKYIYMINEIAKRYLDTLFPSYLSDLLGGCCNNGNGTGNRLNRTQTAGSRSRKRSRSRCRSNRSRRSRRSRSMCNKKNSR